MKRIIAVLAVIAILFSFAACGAKQPADGGKKTLSVAMECGYAPYNWTQGNDANGAVPIADSNEFAYGCFAACGHSDKHNILLAVFNLRECLFNEG